MNPYTGELMALREGQSVPCGFEILPNDLQGIAKLKLAGNERAVVNLNSHSKLAKWAKDKRKAKIAAVSRRKNRK